MSFTLNVDLTANTAGPALAALQAGLAKPRALNAALGGRVKEELQTHFLARNNEPNQRGWPSQGFWGKFSQRIAVQPSEDGVTVAVADPDRALARKFAGGGPITPQEAKTLAIPQTAEAYGKSPRFFNDLHYVPLNRGNLIGALVQNVSTPISFGRRRQDGTRAVKAGEPLGGKVFFFLVRNVNPPVDPRALPPVDALQAALGDATARFFADLLPAATTP